MLRSFFAATLLLGLHALAVADTEPAAPEALSFSDVAAGDEYQALLASATGHAGAAYVPVDAEGSTAVPEVSGSALLAVGLVALALRTRTRAPN